MPGDFYHRDSAVDRLEDGCRAEDYREPGPAARAAHGLRIFDYRQTEEWLQAAGEVRSERIVAGVVGVRRVDSLDCHGPAHSRNVKWLRVILPVTEQCTLITMASLTPQSSKIEND